MAMESWLDANPTKRKTARGIKSFVVRWLSKSQDRGGSSPLAKKKNRLRDKTPEMQLADISWVDPEDREMMKEYYLNKLGYCKSSNRNERKYEAYDETKVSWIRRY